jgi:hypothetical protein
MHNISNRVHLCIQEGGDHLKDIVHKKWKNAETSYTQQ